jgi:hypothetical protein
VELTTEVVQLIKIAYSLLKQNIPLAQAIEYARTGQLPPEPEADMQGLLAQQSAVGADYKNQVIGEMLKEDAIQTSSEYLQVFFPLVAAALNSEVVLERPEVQESISNTRQLILGKRVGVSGKGFLQQVVTQAVSSNLLPQQPMKTAGLLVESSEKK